MRFAGINKNDFINGEDVSVSFWTQGCPHHCKGCHNPETWSFQGGLEASPMQILEEILDALVANGIQRNFSVLGGEPLCAENVRNVMDIISWVKVTFPETKIFLWTGYDFEDIKENCPNLMIKISKYVDVLITGPYVESLRDITLKWRGSSNQKILYKGIDF